MSGHQRTQMKLMAMIYADHINPLYLRYPRAQCAAI